jgi:23S rRNA pseudouridine2605 synthase
MNMNTTNNIRIQKVLADAGVTSRRAAEELILQGRITVNGHLVTKLPCFVNPETDDIRVNGQPVRRRPIKRLYYLLNKPKGVVCSEHDLPGRPRAMELIPHLREKLHCVGGLDMESTGLIILTNDGQLAQRIGHPRYGVFKTYHVQIDGRMSEEDYKKLTAGTYMDGTRTERIHVKMLQRGWDRSLLEVQLAETHNREIRRVFAKLGFHVRRLKRVAFGPLSDRGIKIGHFRILDAREVAMLLDISDREGHPAPFLQAPKPPPDQEARPPLAPPAKTPFVPSRKPPLAQGAKKPYAQGGKKPYVKGSKKPYVQGHKTPRPPQGQVHGKITRQQRRDIKEGKAPFVHRPPAGPKRPGDSKRHTHRGRGSRH